MIIEPKGWLSTKIVTFIASITPSCHDVTRIVSQAQEKPIPFSMKFKLWLHYLICVWCERYMKHLKHLRNISSEIPERSSLIFDEKLSDSVKSNLKQKLREEMEKKNSPN